VAGRVNDPCCASAAFSESAIGSRSEFSRDWAFLLLFIKTSIKITIKQTNDTAPTEAPIATAGLLGGALGLEVLRRSG
jgi:hypothetical protein